MNYFIHRTGQSYGPYSDTQITTFLFEGRVGLSDLARTESLQDWVPLSMIWRTPYAGNSVSWPFYRREWIRKSVDDVPVVASIADSTGDVSQRRVGHRLRSEKEPAHVGIFAATK